MSISAMNKALSVIEFAGLATYRILSAEDRVLRAESFWTACSDDPKITDEIIELTAERYIKGKVTVWRDGAQVPIGKDFPTAPQFREACLQTHMAIYRTLAIGERIGEGGYVLTECVTVRRDDPAFIPALPARDEKKALEARDKFHESANRLVGSVKSGAAAPRKEETEADLEAKKKKIDQLKQEVSR